MFQFEDISYLNYLSLAPILVLIYWLSSSWIQRRMAHIGDPSLVARLLIGYAPWKNKLKFILVLISFILLVIAWANPQWGYRSEVMKAKSSEVFIALDISNSMEAEDVSPSRLERSKRFIQKLLGKLKGDKVGLILFAGQAYLQVPITNDLAAVELFVRSAGPQLAGTQGTNIAESINFAKESFSEEEQFKRALVVITDGEDHDDLAIQTAKEATEQGIIIHAIGVGSSEGGFIPQTIRGVKSYKKDDDGNAVKTRLNPQLIKDLAAAGGGQSYLMDDDEEVITALAAEIDKMEKRETEQQLFSEYNSYFQYFLFFAIILLVLEYLISFKTIGVGTKKWFG